MITPTVSGGWEIVKSMWRQRHNEDHYFLNTNVLDIKDLLALV